MASENSAPATHKQPLISYNALRRARHTIEDVVLTYLPLHGLQLRDFLRWWDVLVFVEGLIYELDEANEALARAGTLEPPPAFHAGLAALRAVLQQEGLLTPAVAEELEAGVAYWRAERALAAAMLAAPVIPAAGHAIFTAEEVEAAAVGKSFDYRLLNLLVSALRGAELPPGLLAFLRVDERLVDISDDLVDYEDDVECGSFNLLRCYCHLWGREAPLRLAAFIGELEARRDTLCAALPKHAREHIAERQVGAAESEGALRWVIPDLILDEAAFRAQE